MLATLTQDASSLASPSVDWSALAPALSLFGTGLLLLIVNTLVSRRLSAGVWSALTVLGAVVAGGFTVNEWNTIRHDGPSEYLGGAFAADGATVFAGGITIVVVFLVALLLRSYLEREDLVSPEPFALLAFSATGGIVMASGNDLLVVFLGLEILSIALYVLASSHLRRLSSAEAGMKYFLLGSFASALFLYGVALTYGATGSTRLGEIATFLDTNVLASDVLLTGGLTLLIVGFVFKVAAAPFHMWAPDVYEGSPTPVVAYMSSAVKAMALVSMFRVLDKAFISRIDQWRLPLLVIIIASLVVGSTLALSQKSMKRALAYSSIGHAGFMLIGIYVGGADGGAATMNYAALYALMAVGSFAVLSVVSGSGDADLTFDSLAGLGRRNPSLAIAMTILAFAQAGVPFTAGFPAKFGVLRAAADGHQNGLAIVAMLAAVVSAFVYLRFIAAMFFGGDDGEAGADSPASPIEVPWTSALAIWLPVIAVLVFGVLPGIVSRLAEQATFVLALG